MFFQRPSAEAAAADAFVAEYEHDFSHLQYIPSPAYWNELRLQESRVFDGNVTSVPFCFFSRSAIAAWEADCAGEYEQYDRALYVAKHHHQRLPGTKSPSGKLALYNPATTDGDRVLAQIFEFDLKPGREELLTYPARCYPEFVPSILASKRTLHIMSLMARDIGVPTSPSKQAAELLLHQLARGYLFAPSKQTE